MSYIFQQLNNIMTGILIVITVFAALFFLIMYRSRKKKRVSFDEDDTDYAEFDRKNVKDYIKIDEDGIKDDMISLENGKRFVGVLRCSGFEFYDEDYAVQAATCQSYYGFVSTINKPISYRQYSKPVDLENTIKIYQDVYQNVLAEYMAVRDELKDIASHLKETLKDLSDEDKGIYEKRIRELERQIEAYKFRLFHIKDEIRVVNKYSSGAVLPDPVETYVFEWQYDPMDFSTDLTQEEIYARAKQELNAKASAMIHALSNSHVKAVRCKTDELIEMFRFYSSPVSASRFKLKDIKNSSFFDDINTSNSLHDLQKQVVDQVALNSQMEYMKDIHENAQEAAKRALDSLQEVYRKAEEEEDRLRQERENGNDSEVKSHPVKNNVGEQEKSTDSEDSNSYVTGESETEKLNNNSDIANMIKNSVSGQLLIEDE